MTSVDLILFPLEDNYRDLFTEVFVDGEGLNL